MINLKRLVMSAAVGAALALATPVIANAGSGGEQNQEQKAAPKAAFRATIQFEQPEANGVAKSTIQTQLGEVEGVASVEVDSAARVVTVSYEKEETLEAIKKAMVEMGLKIGKVNAAPTKGQ